MTAMAPVCEVKKHFSKPIANVFFRSSEQMHILVRAPPLELGGCLVSEVKPHRDKVNGAVIFFIPGSGAELLEESVIKEAVEAHMADEDILAAAALVEADGDRWMQEAGKGKGKNKKGDCDPGPGMIQTIRKHWQQPMMYIKFELADYAALVADTPPTHICNHKVLPAKMHNSDPQTLVVRWLDARSQCLADDAIANSLRRHVESVMNGSFVRPEDRPKGGKKGKFFKGKGKGEDGGAEGDYFGGDLSLGDLLAEGAGEAQIEGAGEQTLEQRLLAEAQARAEAEGEAQAQRFFASSQFCATPAEALLRGGPVDPTGFAQHAADPSGFAAKRAAEWQQGMAALGMVGMPMAALAMDPASAAKRMRLGMPSPSMMPPGMMPPGMPGMSMPGMSSPGMAGLSMETHMALAAQHLAMGGHPQMPQMFM